MYLVHEHYSHGKVVTPFIEDNGFSSSSNSHVLHAIMVLKYELSVAQCYHLVNNDLTTTRMEAIDKGKA